jgi:formamidopyrimidine-DNA glycosylase
VPELPEVETVRRGLSAFLPGRRIAAVEVRHPRAVRRHTAGAADFAARLSGRVVTEVARRGKYLWFVTDDGWAVVGHLGMSGQLVLPDNDRPDSIHLRVRMHFDDTDRALHFVDQRTFGGLLISDLGTAPDGREVPVVIAHVAPDPLEAAFDDEIFSRRLRARRSGLKRALLDQTLVSGIGNIYADEALWRSRLHYDRSTATMSARQVREVLAAVRAVLTDAVAAGGTSFDSLYVNVNGESGWFSRDLAVYGRADEPCRRCGSSIRRDHFMNRSSYTCPRCQRRPPTRSSTL